MQSANDFLVSVLPKQVSPLAAVGTLAAIFVVIVWRNRRAAEDRASTPSILAWNRKSGKMQESIKEYSSLHASGGGSREDRVNNAQDMTNTYYTTATDMYLWGWGESFHFAPRFKGESFEESILRHEHYLASRMRLSPGQHILDVGCGVGGPMRNIAKFTKCRITGLNNNDYQLTRLAAMNAKAGLSDQCEGVKGDFMNLQFEPNSFDGVYAIEATCHAPDRTKCFSEIFRVLKPGGMFCCYEWTMTPKFDPTNRRHVEIKEGIELGNSLPDITSNEEAAESMRRAGFLDVTCEDLALDTQVPWYEPFQPKYTLKGFKTTPIGIKLTNLAVRTMEAIRLAPPGTAEMHSNLVVGGVTLYHSGMEGIFTPMLLLCGRKPL